MELNLIIALKSTNQFGEDSKNLVISRLPEDDDQLLIKFNEFSTKIDKNKFFDSVKVISV
ncbi:hypothetical protein GAG94_03060 [Lysinibacillus sphaericus]|nr:hypothetical protein GAG94_03060 [Lysinibacillus sphaericus]